MIPDVLSNGMIDSVTTRRSIKASSKVMRCAPSRQRGTKEIRRKVNIRDRRYWRQERRASLPCFSFHEDFLTPTRCSKITKVSDKMFRRTQSREKKHRVSFLDGRSKLRLLTLQTSVAPFVISPPSNFNHSKGMLPITMAVPCSPLLLFGLKARILDPGWYLSNASQNLQRCRHRLWHVR